jgi:hypothetical protein
MDRPAIAQRAKAAITPDQKRKDRRLCQFRIVDAAIFAPLRQRQQPK